jgi:peptidoglycan/LPS O-acetylase OafA/YrhL
VGATVVALMRVTSSPTLIFFGSLLTGTIASFVIAAGTFLLIEHPFLLWRDRVFHEHRTERPEATNRASAPESSATDAAGAPA